MRRKWEGGAIIFYRKIKEVIEKHDDFDSGRNKK
jgi:hypothetical protein